MASKEDEEFTEHFKNYMDKLRASNAPMGSVQDLKNYLASLEPISSPPNNEQNNLH